MSTGPGLSPSPPTPVAGEVQWTERIRTGGRRVAAGWEELWGGFAEPAWRTLAATTGIGPGTRVLDVGCGSGGFLAFAAGLGAPVAGVDPAPGMLALPALLRDGGLDVVTAGLVELSWEPPDDDALVRGVLLGADAAAVAGTAPTVLAAACPFRTPSGGYRLRGAFRFAVGRTRSA